MSAEHPDARCGEEVMVVLASGALRSAAVDARWISTEHFMSYSAAAKGLAYLRERGRAHVCSQGVTGSSLHRPGPAETCLAAGHDAGYGRRVEERLAVKRQRDLANPRAYTPRSRA